MTRTFTTISEDHTLDVARSFAADLRRGDVVALYGELGAGKTQFVKGVCRHFGVHELVASPTFILLNRYSGTDESGRELLIYHVDLYRVKSLDEVYDLGFEEFSSGDGICLIEWAERMSQLLPAHRYDILLEHGSSESERIISITKIAENGTDSGSRKEQDVRSIGS